MNAGEVMSHNPIAVPAEAGLAEALRLMFDHHVSGLPVADGKTRLVGILTEGDLLRRSELGTAGQRSRWLDLLMSGRLASEYVRTHTRRVSEIMTRDVVSVAEDTPLTEVVRLMERHRIKRVPVLRDGALIGIVSRADLLHALQRLLVAEPKTAASDETIRQHVLAELAEAPWAPHGTYRRRRERGRHIGRRDPRRAEAQGAARRRGKRARGQSGRRSHRLGRAGHRMGYRGAVG